jgi:hypothetical protein
VTAWLIVFGALLFDVVGGIVVNAASAAVAAAVLAFPVAVAAGFAVVQWRQVRSSGAEPASWWHLAGIGAALVVWLAWPTTPGAIYGVTSARQACLILISKIPTTECLARATRAMDSSNLTWWLTGILIVAAALLTRRSRIAAWAAMPAALAGVLLATHFLELLLLHYRPLG